MKILEPGRMRYDQERLYAAAEVGSELASLCWIYKRKPANLVKLRKL